MAKKPSGKASNHVPIGGRNKRIKASGKASGEGDQKGWEDRTRSGQYRTAESDVVSRRRWERVAEGPLILSTGWV